ncbi:DUF2252 domain-containing protein [Uliginosibacterium sp. 31-12]|uniref:DUF2252 domain-containing protein n=1 Tax=Uliginosibacterium sp. 31-12 TaxID=3062781 RepID=UPI0026E1AB0D|nr:DUF2252 family protein [Uliginosibacterium sp. 31-12]MDO6386891.1 DUF2252 family protein [Uliginosibacterium sp. 31-12]
MSHTTDDAVELLKHSHAGRDPERLALKYALLRRDPFAFLRGTSALFHARMPNDKLLYKAPLAWTCGDLHLENFGSYKGDNRLVYFDLNDFDEATLAPASWALTRFVSSVLVAAPALDFDRDEALAHAGAFIEAYASALSAGRARWLERDTADGLIRDHLEALRCRSRKDLLDRRCTRRGKRRSLKIDGKKALPASDKQQHKVRELMTRFASEQADPKFFEVLDVARRVSGNASLGLERYVILVRGEGGPDNHALLDLKEAPTSTLTPHLRTPEPRWASEAHRVIGVQQMMQAIPVAFLHPLELGRRSAVLRELQPAEDRIDLREAAGKNRSFREMLGQMGELVAWAQLRSSGRKGSAIADELIEFGTKHKWRSRLLALAEHCAEQVEADWLRYCVAYDDGAFKP